MNALNRTHFETQTRPIKVLQFGSGNFLRAFIDWQIQILNDHTTFNAGIICAERSLNPSVGTINRQDGLYHTIISGIDEKGNETQTIQRIDCIQSEIDMSVDFLGFLEIAKIDTLEWVFSNTTEAGISFCDTDRFEDLPPDSFPAKLTRFLFERYRFFKGDPAKGLTLLPCELIDHNGKALKELVIRYINKWQLEEGFYHWVDTANLFCSTLVDRIVPGFPFEQKEKFYQEIGEQDEFMVMAEYFYLFVIEGPSTLKKRLHLDEVPLNIIITDDISPYKQRKVAILNGGHTGLMPIAYLSGKDTVKDALADPQLAQFLDGLLEHEVIPSLSLPKEELLNFSQEVLRRFKNPHIHHLWLSIALNSMAKFKSRNLPALLDFIDKKKGIPAYLSFSLAALILFYRGIRNGTSYALNDETDWLDCFEQVWNDIAQQKESTKTLVTKVLSQRAHWGEDLSLIDGLTDTVTAYLDEMMTLGMSQALSNFLSQRQYAS